MEPLRIGFIGAGENTRSRHLPGFQAIEGVVCAAVCNRSEESARRVAAEFGVLRVVADWRDIIADDAIDAVCIGTWPNMHAETTVAALDAGKHVLVEARMARNLIEACAMQAAAACHPDLVSQIVPAPLSLNYDATIRRLLPDLGVLREARITSSSATNSSPATPLSWRQDVDLSGVNTMTLGILYETLQRWLGPPDPDWIAAEARTFTPMRCDREGNSHAVTVPDSVSVLGGYASGMALVACVTSVASGPAVSEIRLDGESGTLRMDLSNQRLMFSAVGSQEENEIPPDVGTAHGWQVEADFAASIRDGRPVKLTTFVEGVRYMTFTELAHRSWNAGGSRLRWES